MLPSSELPCRDFVAKSDQGLQCFSLLVSRSSSARQAPVQDGFYERRRSSSCDDSNGQLSAVAMALKANMGCTSCFIDQELMSRSKGSSYRHGSMWLFGRSSKSIACLETDKASNIKNTESLDHRRPVVDRKPDQTVSKWKAFLANLRSKVKKMHRASINSSVRVATTSKDWSEHRSTQQALYGSRCSKQQIRLKVPVQADQKPKHYIVYPDPLPKPVPRQISLPPIWERRKVQRPSSLDLSLLKVTGMKQLKRSAPK